ncbi:MAG: helix-turn-helix domain-containing protein [Clostridia bacterium]|nr:helix-turn-helix domain-containing protein [Clostridia bacterium]
MNLNISSFIRQKRKDLRFTQDELANKLCVSKATISKWELAQCYPDITMLPNIAELFGCSIDELLGYRNSKVDYLEKGKRILREFTATTGFTRKLVLVNIVSANPVRLSEFYRDILEANIINDREHGGPNRIEIWFGERDENAVCIAVNYQEDYVPAKTTTCQGFEFRVANADAEYKRMLNMGIKIEQEPQNLPWGYRYFNIKDPDGNGIDIVQAL